MSSYEPIMKGPCVAKLKYGENPHQQGEGVIPEGIEVFFKNPGHINWQDVSRAFTNAHDTSIALEGTPVATSYKHKSVAGAGYALELNEVEEQIFTKGKRIQEFLDGNHLSEQAIAYLRATWPDRNASFGEVVGLSHLLDYETAIAMDYKLVDAIICPGFNDDAMDLINSRKYVKERGGIPVITVAKDFNFPERVSMQTDLGVTLTQDRDTMIYDYRMFQSRDEVEVGDLYGVFLTNEDFEFETQKEDLILTAQGVKFSESNNVGMGYRGCALNCAGGQKRVLSARIAKEKWLEFMMLQHPEVLAFEPEKKGFITGHHERLTKVRSYTPKERIEFVKQFASVGDSDAFFPFPDALEELIEGGAKVVNAPFGSKNDQLSIDVANEKGITLIATRIKQEGSECWQNDMMARKFKHS